MKNVLVTTTLEQYLEVSDETTLDDVLSYLSNNQSFREAFEDMGKSNMQFLNITVANEKAEFYIDEKI